MAAALCGTAFIDACALISPADAQALFKEPLGSYSAYANGQCNWPVANTSKNASLDIDVEVGPDVITRLADVMGPVVNSKPLSGVGDQATWEVNGVNPTLGAVKGEVSCEISGDGDNTSFATTVNGNPPFDEIDPAALPGFMAKFGTLCNDVFASLGETSGQAAATNAPVASSSAAAGLDVCALLPAAQVAQITGFTIIGSSPHSSPVIANAFGCTYQFGVTVDVETSGGAADYDAEVARYATNAIPIAGFGDKAFQDFTDGLGVVALFGDTQFDVYVLDSGNQEGDINHVSEALIDALRSKL